MNHTQVRALQFSKVKIRPSLFRLRRHRHKYGTLYATRNANHRIDSFLATATATASYKGL